MNIKYKNELEIEERDKIIQNLHQKIDDRDKINTELEHEKNKVLDRIEEIDPNSPLNLIRKLEGDGIWRYQITQTDNIETEDRSIVYYSH